MRVWYFIAYAYSCFLNMHGYEPSVARSRFDFVMHLYLHPFCVEERSRRGYGETVSMTGPRSAVGNVSSYRCVSDCRSRGSEFNPGPVPYFHGD